MAPSASRSRNRTAAGLRWSEIGSAFKSTSGNNAMMMTRPTRKRMSSMSERMALIMMIIVRRLRISREMGLRSLSWQGGGSMCWISPRTASGETFSFVDGKCIVWSPRDSMIFVGARDPKDNLPRNVSLLVDIKSGDTKGEEARGVLWRSSSWVTAACFTEDGRRVAVTFVSPAQLGGLRPSSSASSSRRPPAAPAVSVGGPGTIEDPLLLGRQARGHSQLRW